MSGWTELMSMIDNVKENLQSEDYNNIVKKIQELKDQYTPTDAEIVERFMDKHVIVGEYFPKNNIDMGDVVPEHIDDMVEHLQGNWEYYVSTEYDWARVEHPEWFGGEE